MSDLISFVFSAGGIVVALLVGVGWLWRRPQSSLPRRVLFAVTIAYWLASTYAVQALVTRVLVHGFHPFVSADITAGRYAIVVLGSGSFTARDWNNNEYSMPDSGAAARVLEAARVYHLANPVVVISSGGKVDDADPRIPTALAMRHALIELGVPDKEIVLQMKSRNTHEEAIDNSRLCSSLNVDRIIVVTSDFHMRRAVGTFRAAGVKAVPAIARDPLEPRAWYDIWLPSDLGLMKAGANAHELIGILYYAVRGWYVF